MMADKLFTKRLRELTDDAIRESLAEISVEFEKRFGPAAWNTRATQPLSLTVDEAMVIARLRELLAKCPALPIAARPQEHDDWGVIRSLSRNEEGFQPVFARAYSGRYETDIELNAHRRAKTDPTQDTMDLIVEGLNALPALLDRLQSLSLPVAGEQIAENANCSGDIDRSGLAQEVET